MHRMTETTQLEIIRTPQKNFLLSHDELARRQQRGDTSRDNIPSFKKDYADDILNRYKGEAVAYHKGTLCGHSEVPDFLFKEACNYYGKSDLAVFIVPHVAEGIEKVVKTALGEK